MEVRIKSPTYQAIAEDLIASEECLLPIQQSDVIITCLASDAEKRKNRKVVFAECEKVPDKYKWAVPCDFTITVFEPNCERLTDEQMRIVMLHELMHVGIEMDGNEARFFTRPHDVEDFKAIIERFGMEWSNG